MTARFLMADVATKNQRRSVVRLTQVRRSEVGTWGSPSAHTSLLAAFSEHSDFHLLMWSHIWCNSAASLYACPGRRSVSLDAGDFDLGGSHTMLCVGPPACTDLGFPTKYHFSRACFLLLPPVSHSQACLPFRYGPRRSTLWDLGLKSCGLYRSVFHTRLPGAFCCRIIG